MRITFYLCELIPPKLNPSLMMKKIRQIPNEGHYQVTDEYYSKPSRLSKTMKVGETVTVKRGLRRHYNLMQCRVLDGILREKKFR